LVIYQKIDNGGRP